MSRRSLREKIECPHCHCLKSRVVNVKRAAPSTAIYRRVRKCEECKRTFVTEEKIIDAA